MRHLTLTLADDTDPGDPYCTLVRQDDGTWVDPEVGDAVRLESVVGEALAWLADRQQRAEAGS